MKNIALIAGLSLALSTAALADNGPVFKGFTSDLDYSRGTSQTYGVWENSCKGLKYDTLVAANGTMLVSAPQMKVTGPDLTTWGWSYYYDIKSKDSAIVITKPVFLATNLVGVKGLNMSVEGFAGLGLETGRPLAGIAGIFKGKVADQIWLGVGPGITAQNERPLGFGVIGQLTVKF